MTNDWINLEIMVELVQELENEAGERRQDRTLERR